MDRLKAIVGVSDTATDRALGQSSAFLSSIARNPLATGVLVTAKPASEGRVRVNHGLGRKAVGAIVLSSDVGLHTASLVSSDQTSAIIAVERGYEFVERYDFVTSGSSFDFSARLNCNTDHEYNFRGLWKSDATQNRLRLRVNGASSSGLSNCHTREFISSTGTQTGSGLIVGNMPSAAAGEHWIDAKLLAPLGQNRLLRGNDVLTDGTAAANTDEISFGGKWEDTTTRIVSLGLNVSTANNILADSWFELYRRPKLTGRTIKMWIF